jgi:tetratricopeptide (TPR) repeat protein
LGEEHHHLAVAINNLGGYYLELEKFDQAAPLFERALAILENALGASNPALIIHVYNLSTVYKVQRRIKEAMVLEERAQALILKKLSKEGNSGTQNLLLHAHSLQVDNQYEKAHGYLLQALEIAEAEFGKNSMRAAHILDFLGTNSLKQKDVTQSAYYFTRSLAIKKMALPAGDEDLAATEQNLKFLAALKGDKTAMNMFFPPSESNN